MFILLSTADPTIPLTIFAGLDYASYRLRRKEIYPVNMYKISEAGLIKLICFDKTGALTNKKVTTAGYMAVCEYEKSGHSSTERGADFKKWYINNLKNRIESRMHHEDSQKALPLNYANKAIISEDHILFVNSHDDHENHTEGLVHNNESDAVAYHFNKTVFTHDFTEENAKRPNKTYLNFVIAIGLQIMSSKSINRSSEII